MAVVLCKATHDIKLNPLRLSKPLIRLTDDKLETDFAYKVDPKDICNYKVLQRRTNLIVDLNTQRTYPSLSVANY